jgi:hypothetical protein
LFDGVDALAGVANSHHVARQQQDGVGFFAGPADAAAELIEIGEAEAVASFGRLTPGLNANQNYSAR